MNELAWNKFRPSANLVRLSQLGAIGHIRGILAKLDEVGAVQPSAAPTLAYLRRLAEDCDLDGYNDTIEALVSHDVVRRAAYHFGGRRCARKP